jgi:hypothetical protein
MRVTGPGGLAAAGSSASPSKRALLPSSPAQLRSYGSTAGNYDFEKDVYGYTHSSQYSRGNSNNSDSSSLGSLSTSSYLMHGLQQQQPYNSNYQRGGPSAAIADRVSKLTLTEGSFSRSPVVPSSSYSPSHEYDLDSTISSARSRLFSDDHQQSGDYRGGNSPGRMTFGTTLINSSPSRGGGPTRRSVVGGGVASTTTSSSSSGFLGASEFLLSTQVQAQLSQIAPATASSSSSTASSYPLDPEQLPVPERLGDLRALMTPFYTVLLFENMEQGLLKSPMVRALVPGDLVMRALFTKLESGGASGDEISGDNRQQKGTADVAAALTAPIVPSQQGPHSAYSFLSDAGLRRNNNNNGPIDLFRSDSKAAVDHLLQSGGGSGLYYDHNSGAYDSGYSSFLDLKHNSGLLADADNNSRSPLSSAVSRYVQQAPEGYSFSSSPTSAFSSSYAGRLDDIAASADKDSLSSVAAFEGDPWVSVLQVAANQSYSFALRGTGTVAPGGYSAPVSSFSTFGTGSSSGPGPLSHAISILTERGQLVGLSPIAVCGRKPATRRYGELRLHPGGKACIGDPALAKLLGVDSSLAGAIAPPPTAPAPPLNSAASSKTLITLAGGSDYRLFDLSSPQKEVGSKAATASNMVEAQDELDIAVAAAASRRRKYGAAAASAASGNSGDYSSTLQSFLPKRFQPGHGLVGSVSLTDITTVTCRWDSYSAEDYQLSNAGKTIKALPHVQPSSKVKPKARSAYHDLYSTLTTSGVATTISSDSTNGGGVWSQQFDDEGNQLPQLLSLAATASPAGDAAGSSGSAGTGAAASSATAPTPSGFLKSSEQPNPYRLDSFSSPGSNPIPIASSTRAGSYMTALPAVAVPLPPASAAGKTGVAGSRATGPLSVLGLQDPSDPFSPVSMPSPLSDKVALGFGVVTAGRWSWSLVIEESEALFDPLEQPFLEYLRQTKGQLPVAASSFAGSTTAGSLVARTSTASLINDNAKRMSMALRAAGIATPGPLAASGIFAMVGANATPAAGAGGPTAAAGGTGGGLASTASFYGAFPSKDGSGFGMARNEAILYSTPSFGSFEVAIALIPAGSLIHPSTLKGSSLDHSSCEPLLVLTNRGHVYARGYLPDSPASGAKAPPVSTPAFVRKEDSKKSLLTAPSTTDLNKTTKKPTLGSISEEDLDDELGLNTTNHGTSDGAAGAGGTSKPLGPLGMVACGLTFGVSSNVIISVDTVAGHVGLSISNTRPLSGPSAAEQAGALADSLLTLGALAGNAVSGPQAGYKSGDEEEAARMQQVEQLSSILDNNTISSHGGGGSGSTTSSGPLLVTSDRTVDPSVLNAPSTLSPPHNVNHPFSLPAEAHTKVEDIASSGGSAATLHTPDPLSGEGSCLHALVMGMPFTALFQQLRGQSRLPSGVGALQLAMIVRDGEGFQATLLPPPLMAASSAARENY